MKISTVSLLIGFGILLFSVIYGFILKYAMNQTLFAWVAVGFIILCLILQIIESAIEKKKENKEVKNEGN